MTQSAVAGADPTLDTSKRFGFEWDRYQGLYPHYEEQFLGWVAPLTAVDFSGRDVLDAGCGMGRNSRWAAKYGARSVLAIDYAQLAVDAAASGLADLANVSVERQSIYELDRVAAFDLCFSIGVIHHLEFPERAIARLHRALRPGGKLVVWLYGYEGNEVWVRFFRAVHPILKRLPPALVHALAYLVSAPIFAGLRLGLHRVLRLGNSRYLDAVARFPFAHLHKIVFDQLLPDIAHYYERAEVEALFARQSWGDVSIHHNRGYSWTVICQRP